MIDILRSSDCSINLFCFNFIISTCLSKNSDCVAVTKDPELDEDVPMDFDKPVSNESEDDTLEDDKVQQLLAGLDDV